VVGPFTGDKNVVNNSFLLKCRESKVGHRISGIRFDAPLKDFISAVVDGEQNDQARIRTFALPNRDTFQAVGSEPEIAGHLLLSTIDDRGSFPETLSVPVVLLLRP
jgi:hypothetical protein